MYRRLFLILLLCYCLFAGNLSTQEIKDGLILDTIIYENDKAKVFKSYKKLFFLTNEQIYLQDALNYAVDNESLQFLKDNIKNEDYLEQINIRLLFLNQQYDECLQKIVEYTNKKESKISAFFYIRISFLLKADVEKIKKFVEKYYKKYKDIDVVTFFIVFLSGSEDVNLKMLINFIKKYEKDILDKLFLLKIYINFADLKEAEKLVKKIEKDYKDNKEFIYIKNYLLYELSKEKKDYKSAIKYVEIIKEIEQDNSIYYNRIINLLNECLENNDFLNAVMILEKYQLNNLLLANIYVRLNEFSKASKIYYDLSLQADGDNMNYLGLSYVFSLYANANNYKDYFKIDEIIAKGGASDELINSYAYYLVDKKVDVNKAYKLMSKIMLDEKNKTNPYYLDTYAWILYYKKDCKQAYNLIKKAISLSKEYAKEKESKEHLLRIEKCKN